MSDKKASPVQNTWEWKALGRPAPAKKPMSIKTKAAIQVPIMALVGWVMFSHFHHHVMPVIIWSLAGLVFIGGWFIPPLFHGIEKIGKRFADLVVTGLNWILLVPFYYLVFLPGRIILKLQGIDPMDRTFPDDRASFWIPRKPVADVKQYRKQH